jgi:hypothetical protein
MVTELFPGFWGTWGEEVVAPADYRVVGLQVRLEDPQGPDGDDTAMNGLRLYHCPTGGDPLNDRAVMEVTSGFWGTWRGIVLLPRDHYLAGLQARLEGPQGGQPADDDTALNGLRMISRLLPTDWRAGTERYAADKQKRTAARKLAPTKA